MKRIACFLVLALALSACTPEPMVRPDAAEASARVELAMLVEAGRYDDSLALLRTRLGELGPAEQVELRLDAAELFLAAEQANTARLLIGQSAAGPLDRLGEARLVLARAELALIEGDDANAAWLLTQAERELPAALRSRHSALELRLQRLEQQPATDAVPELEASLRQGDFSPELALALLIERPLAELQALLLQHGGRPALSPWLDLAATARAHLLDDEQLAPALAAWERRHPRVGYPADEALAWIVAWRQIQPLPARIAILLPGRESALARPGRALRDGLMATWLSQPIEHRPELLFLYTQDRPGSVIEAWFSARERGADLVIGPLAREQVDELIDLGDGSLPVLLLNHPTDRNGLVRFPGLASAYALTPEDEAELAAAMALVRGHRRVLILRQGSDWGNRVADSFAATFRTGGGRIVRDSSYPIGQVDHSLLLEVVLGLDRSRERGANLQRMLGQPLEVEPARRTDADLIFLASRAEDARALRPQLRFFGAGDVPVLATSHVLAGAPDARRDQDLDGVVLPLSPWFMPDGEAARLRRQAEQRYRDLDNPALSRLFALGADALQLSGWLTPMRADPNLYLPGLTGRLRMTDHGLIDRDLPFVRIVDGEARAE